LFFVALDRAGLGSWQVAGVVVTAVAATVPAAVAVTLDRLGARPAARMALPFLVVGPSAIWMAVSADAVFAATAAWAMATLAGAVGSKDAVGATGTVSTASAAGAGATDAVGATGTVSTASAVGAVDVTRRWPRWGAATVSGVLFGWCLLQSYGLVLLGLLALAVLVAARGPARERVRIGAGVAAVALGVVVAFAMAGFAWWDAYPVLHERYWAGLAQARPGWYWVVGNLAALVLCAGPLLPAALAAGLPRSARARHRAGVHARAMPGHPATASALVRGSLLTRVRAAMPAHVSTVVRDPVAALVVAALGTVLVADLSLMSKAEVERIWLPFVP
ncbi:MAG: hypothetical protein ACRCSN_12985, partial [Dermatophilaceae bacterium]